MSYFEELSTKELYEKINSEHWTDDEIEEYYTNIREDETNELDFSHDC